MSISPIPRAPNYQEIEIKLDALSNGYDPLMVHLTRESDEDFEIHFATLESRVNQGKLPSHKDLALIVSFAIGSPSNKNAKRLFEFAREKLFTEEFKESYSQEFEILSLAKTFVNAESVDEKRDALALLEDLLGLGFRSYDRGHNKRAYIEGEAPLDCLRRQDLDLNQEPVQRLFWLLASSEHGSILSESQFFPEGELIEALATRAHIKNKADKNTDGELAIIRILLKEGMAISNKRLEGLLMFISNPASPSRIRELIEMIKNVSNAKEVIASNEVLKGWLSSYLTEA